MPSVTLNAIQDEAIEAHEAARLKGGRSTIIRLPTGAGKTRVAGRIIRRGVRERGARYLFNIHRHELAVQAVAEFTGLGIPLCVEMSDFGHALRDISRGARPHVVIASKDTLQDRNGRTRLSSWPKDYFTDTFDDECHMARATTWDNIYDHFTGIGFRTGLSATPYRYDGKRLYGRKGAPYDGVCYRYTIEQAIRNGHLADIVGHRIPCGVDMKDVKTTGDGDYSVTELAARIRPHIEILANAIRQELDEFKIERAILFAPDVGCARAVAEALNSVVFGVCKAVHGDNPQYPMSAAQRAQTIGEYHEGMIRVLCTCDLLTTGFNDRPTQAIIILRLTRSLGLFTQIVGRGTRLCLELGKEICHVIGFDWKNADDDECSTVDLFLEDEDEYVRQCARRKQRERGKTSSPREVIEEAREEARMERSARGFDLDIERRKIDYRRLDFRPYTAGALLGIEPIGEAARGIFHEPLTKGQEGLLRELGIKTTKGLTKPDATRLIDECQKRAWRNLADPQQIVKLVKRGVDPEAARAMTSDQALVELSRPTEGQRARLLSLGFSREQVERMVRDCTWKRKMGRGA